MRRPVVALCVLIPLVAACSSSGSKAANQSTSTSSSAAASTTTTVFDPKSVAAVPSAGCGTTPAVAPGEATTPFTAAGADGSFIQHVPPAYDGKTPVPLVLDLHGYSEPASIQASFSGLAPFGDAHGFVTLTPETVHPVALWDTAIDSPDTRWLSALLDDAEARLCIDTARVFSTGLSQGAFMTSTLACVLSDRLAAVAPVAGIQLRDGCAPARPVPVLAIHGTADTFVAYDGGLGASVKDLPSPDGSGKTIGEGAVTRPGGGMAVPDIVAGWAARNGCSDGAPTTTTVAADVDLIAFTCPRGAETELFRVTGGGHTWPGSAFAKNIESYVGHTTDSISATEEIWKFFEAHPLVK